LPGIVTVGYTTATQAPNGVIHVVTSKSSPPVHIELNQQWVLNGGPEAAGPEGQYRLEGKQSFAYPDGRKMWEVTYLHGRAVSVETWWAGNGVKQWEKNHGGDNWTWKIFDGSGRITAESRWHGKDLVDANTGGPLAPER
jgi:hypothetical protein